MCLCAPAPIKAMHSAAAIGTYIFQIGPRHIGPFTYFNSAFLTLNANPDSGL